MTQTFEVTNITEKTQGNGNFIIHLEHSTPEKETPLGKIPKKVIKYYMEVEEPTVSMGDSIKLDLSLFTIKRREFTTDDQRVISTNWLE